MEILNQQLFAGDAWSWIEAPEEFPSGLFSLNLTIKYRSSSPITIAGVPSGDGFLFSIAANTTKDYPAGDYSYQFVVSNNSGVKKTIETGTVKIALSLAAAGESREYWKRIYDNLLDQFEKLSKHETSEVQYNGRLFKYQEREELLRLLHNIGVKCGAIKPVKRINFRFL